MQSQELMLSQTNDMRTQLINDGERDEMSLLKQSHVPELKCGHVIQHAFKIDNNNETNEIRYEWFTGTLSKVSDGLN